MLEMRRLFSSLIRIWGKRGRVVFGVRVVYFYYDDVSVEYSALGRT